GHGSGDYLQSLPAQQWAAAAFEWAMTRGQGMPGSRWLIHDHGIRQLSGHENDFLYFQSPLRGNFDIDCLTTTFDWQECEMFFNGRWAGPAWGMTHYESGDHRRSYRKLSLGPKLPNEVGPWFHIRIRSRDGVGRIFANGRQLYEESPADDHDPWIGGRFWHRYHGAIRDVRITGTPEIPDTIRMVHDDALTGWSAYYEPQNFERLIHWSHANGELTGARLKNPEQANHERLLRYHRPMLEDGSIQYEFFYDPEQFHVHPVLDRLAFVLSPEDVRVHWCTDGAFDQTGLSPSNLSDEPQHRIGSRPLPLKNNSWNRLRISVTGDHAELFLNDVPVFRRRLEVTNMRRFGFFYFPGRTAARIRNVYWTGDWPKTLPPLHEQELADTAFLTDLDQTAETLPGSFRIDFSETDALPEGFRINRDTAGNVASNAEFTGAGLMTLQQGDDPEKWRVMAVDTPFALQGDFDIIAAYDDFRADIPQRQDRFNGICLRLGLECQPAVNPFLHLRRSPNDNVFLDTMVEYGLEDGGSRWDVKAVNEESTAGRLRLARRNNLLHFLAANGDSDQFRLLKTREVPDAPVKAGSLELQVLMGGIGRTSATWKSLTVRAAVLSTE
ncbi:MAG: DUF1583 domain-containing protein, partial [Planctomycetaceae bacterium]|nr:DUF1583 domain-containing protein [Planctomycetaceae bacterium]